MKLLYILAAILALTFAEEDKNVKEMEKIEDLEAASSNIELLKEGADLTASAYAYVPPSQRPPKWQSNQNSWEYPQAPSQPADAAQPTNEVQNDYYWSSGSGQNYHPPTTTTPVPVIKNEQYIGDNGNYNYEYQIGDGTHVAEQGYYLNGKQDEENLVKKGFYSYLGADGKTYTVTYWADKTGFHAFGDHLPKAPVAQQPSLQQQNDETPAYVPMPQPAKPTYPTQQPQKPTYVPAQSTYVPPQPTYPQVQNPTHNPPQQTYNPPQQNYNPPQQTYNPPQQTYNPPQQTYNPPQQTYNPPQQTYNPPQQTYNPPQQTYNPPQQTYNPPQQTYNPTQQTYYPQQQQTYPQQNYYNYNV